MLWRAKSRTCCNQARTCYRTRLTGKTRTCCVQRLATYLAPNDAHQPFLELDKDLFGGASIGIAYSTVFGGGMVKQKQVPLRLAVPEVSALGGHLGRLNHIQVAPVSEGFALGIVVPLVSPNSFTNSRGNQLCI
jgi:hypothetical protein